MAWYKVGTASVTNGLTSVNGTGTNWASNARVGDGFRGPDGEWYEIVNIASETTLGIYPAYAGTTDATGVYIIAPLQGYVKESADRLRAITVALEGAASDVTQARDDAQASAAASALSETNAKASEIAATASASAAGSSETNASTSSGIALTSAANANNSAISAQDSKESAEASRNLAEQWANNPEDQPVTTSPDKFSAYHWAMKAEEASGGGYAVSSVNGKTGVVVLDKSDVGLPNVDDTSDANKPVSTAQQIALDGKVDKVSGKQLSTEDYTSSDKNKLAAIETQATKNQSDSYLLDRTNHTGSQLASTISDLAQAVRTVNLSGLPAFTVATITATDTVLSAFAKLQGQTSSKFTTPPSDGKTYGIKDGSAIEISSSGGGGRFFGELVMLPNRQSSPNGVVKADGQLISNASAQYPAVVADLQSATPSVPVVTAAVWLSDPSKRACWAYDSTNDQIRVPDWNGMQLGSIGPLFFRGDGNFGWVAGSARMDQMQVITGTIDEGGAKLTASTGTTGAFAPAAVSSSNRPSPASAAGYAITFDSSRVARTGGETFGKHGLGVWGVVLFGSVSNPGAADAAALATSYANQQTAINALNDALGFAYLYPNGGTQAAPANVAVNSRYEMANPFPGHEVIVVAELQVGGRWGDAGWFYSNNGYGTKGSQLDLNTIVVQTGTTRIGYSSPGSGDPFGRTDTNLTSAPCRVKVWRVKA